MANMKRTRAEFLQFIKSIDKKLGDIVGKMGGYTLYKLHGTKVYRRLPQRLSPPSPAQKAQRKKFAILQSLSRAFRSFLPQTLRLRKKLKPANAFIKVNQNLVQIDRATKKLEVDYTKLDFTGQKDCFWISPKVAEFHKNSLTIEWKVCPISFQAYGQPDSPRENPPLVHFVLFCPAKNQSLHFRIPLAQEKQEVIYPKAWEGELILLFSFIQKGRKFTQTHYMGSIRHIRHKSATVRARHAVPQRSAVPKRSAHQPTVVQRGFSNNPRYVLLSQRPPPFSN
jgi:hypothetical protein